MKEVSLSQLSYSCWVSNDGIWDRTLGDAGFSPCVGRLRLNVSSALGLPALLQSCLQHGTWGILSEPLWWCSFQPLVCCRMQQLMFPREILCFLTAETALNSIHFPPLSLKRAWVTQGASFKESSFALVYPRLFHVSIFVQPSVLKYWHIGTPKLLGTRNPTCVAPRCKSPYFEL